MNPQQRRIEKLEVQQAQQQPEFVTVVELPEHVTEAQAAVRLVVATGVPQAPRQNPAER